jgi:membrane protein DedA with SNARE-associated domain
LGVQDSAFGQAGTLRIGNRKATEEFVVGNIIETVAGFITWIIATAGYAGVAILMAVESACIPLPSEIILPFAGYLVSTGRFSLLLVATAGALGCNLGSTVAYYAAARGGDALVRRWGAVLFIRPDEIEWVKRFFARYGAATVFIGRLLPVVRTFIAVPAGLARMPLWKFQAYTFVGSWLWCLALAYAGMKLGEKWNSDPVLRSWFHRLDIVIVATIGAGIAWLFWRRVKSRSPGL